MTEVIEDVHPDSGVSTAVGFLDDVSKKNWNEADLRRYLIGKRGLSNTQVQEAFRIHHAKSTRRSRNCSTTNINMDDEKAFKSPSSGSAERPELQITSPQKDINAKSNNAKNNSSYLMLSKKADGEKLIEDFLLCEKGYCGVLECLNHEYLQELIWQAGRGAINFGQEELRELFSHIPKLLNFHKSFYTDLMVGSNIGRLFIRRLSFFKTYGEYIKEVTSIIEMLRKHIFDRKLWKCIGSIRSRSRLTSNDLTDLLITPLDRIIDYQIFLGRLHLWADKAQAAEYEFFAKAARRIGRVAKYIETYRHGVINRSEMNRVQQYLGNHCWIIEPDRSIIRRGVITRRTSGWTSRKKKYHFFLFTDALLWTKQNGTIKNIVKLFDCKLLPSDAKYDSNRKFKISIDMTKTNPGTKQKTKILLLECDTERQRETWYNTLADALKSANEMTGHSKLEEQFDYTMENDSDEKESSRKNTFTEDDFSPGRMKSRRENESEDWGTQALVSPDAPWDAYHDRYKSENFVEQKFQDFDPMDDTESQLSEYDHSFFEKFGANDQVSSKSLISPHQKASKGIFDDEKIGERTKREIEDGMDAKVPSPRSCEIKRMSGSITTKYLSGEEMDVKRTSSFRVHLSDGMLEPNADLVISLSGVV